MLALMSNIDAFEDSMLDEMSKALRQHVSGDPEMALKVREASKAEEGIPDDQQTPPIPEYVEALCDRAILCFETCTAHETGV